MPQTVLGQAGSESEAGFYTEQWHVCIKSYRKWVRLVAQLFKHPTLLILVTILGLRDQTPCRTLQSAGSLLEIPPSHPLLSPHLCSKIKSFLKDKKIKKQDLSICSLQETNFRPEDTYRLKVKGWKNVPCKWKCQGSEEAWVPIHISDKINFKTKTMAKNKERHL